MSADQTVRALFGSPGEPEDWALPLGPGRWHVLFAGTKRPLLVPENAPDVHRRLTYFLGGGWKAIYAQIMLRMNAALPRAGLLPSIRAGDGGHGFFLDRQGYGRPSQSMAEVGLTGPHRKASVLLASAQGDAVAHAKIAMAPGADKQLTAEAEWLRALESAPELNDQIPRLLAEGLAPNGRRYIVTTLVPATRRKNSFTAAHAAFLGALGRAQQHVMSFAASPCYQHVAATMGKVEACFTVAERSALSAALQHCRSSLAGWTGPFVLAHGDFAPWNIRVSGERIFVLNWEHARSGANPLSDVLNYFLSQKVMSGRSVEPRHMGAALRRVDGLIRELYPEWTWRSSVISALALASLLDVLVRHATGRRSDVRSHPVVARYFHLIQLRSAWMAA